MFKNDYLLKIIEEIADFFKDVKKLLTEGKCKDAEGSVDEAMQKFLGLSADTIKVLPYNDLISFMNMDRERGTEKCIILAALLTQKGDILEKMNNPESTNYHLKALNVFTEVFDDDENIRLKEYFSQIDYLIDKLKGYVFSTELNQKIFKYYEASGKYDKAEDMMYNLLEESNWDKTLIIEGINFYERLLKKNEDELIKGNLPKDEIVDGIEVLSKKLQ